MKTVNESFGVEFELHKELVKGKTTNSQPGDNDSRTKY
jgi:hypothetical protein